jgi:phage-related minor tail protein
VAPAPANNPEQPPRTVEEMAKRANQKTAEQLKKNNEDVKDKVESFGDKVGDTTKKTWRCIASLFTHCTD